MAPYSLISIQVGPRSCLDRTLSGLWDWTHTTPHAPAHWSIGAGCRASPAPDSQEIGTLQGTLEGYVSIPCGNDRISCISGSAASAEEMLTAER